MKKRWLIVWAVLLVTVLTVAAHAAENRQIVRMHIRASGNDPDAQTRKLAARDAVNELLAPMLEKCETREEALTILRGNAEAIRRAAEEASGQPAAVRLCEEAFPEKVYGELVLPAGTYTSLLIELDGGAGRNWWCVAFPPLCYTSREGTTEYRSWIFDTIRGWLK